MLQEGQQLTVVGNKDKSLGPLISTSQDMR